VSALRRAAWLLAPLALVQLAGPARAADPAPPDPYQQALQSIAEGRKNDASATLSSIVEQEPLHAGAWLDLALIQCSLGHADEAERLFQAIEKRFAPPPGILELINAARQKGCTEWHPQSSYSVTLARGVDQNVNQGASNPFLNVDSDGAIISLPLLPDFLPKHDQYSALWADYTRDLTTNGTTGFVQLLERRNDHLTHYNSSSLFTGVETPWRWGRWAASATATIGLFTLGGQYYQRQTQGQIKIGTPLPPEHTDVLLTAAFSHNKFMTLSNFDAVTSELRGQVNYRGHDSVLTTSLGWLLDHAQSDRPGGDRHGWNASVTGRRALAGPLIGEASFSEQNWRSDSDYSPGLIDIARRQTTRVGRMAMIWQLNDVQSVQLELRQVRNAENISIFQYNDRQLQLSWQWQGR